MDRINIYPHAHLDIGYTNLQKIVEKLQVRNIDVGIDLAPKTQHYPEGARFCGGTLKANRDRKQLPFKKCYGEKKGKKLIDCRARKVGYRSMVVSIPT